VLVLRSLSIVIDRQHFVAMLAGLDREVSTITFSMFPVAMLMACIALAHADLDTSRPAGILLRLIAWGGMVKTSLLILVPGMLAVKAQALGRAGVLDVVLVMTLAVGGYFTWVGYFESPQRARSNVGARPG
jgi:hypothetical protein